MSPRAVEAPRVPTGASVLHGDRVLIAMAPALGPWLLYLVLLLKTRWGRASSGVHLAVLFAWHALGVLVGIRAAMYYAE